MNDWFKVASATFSGGAVAIALIAIPTFVWLPREFDEIQAGTKRAEENSLIAAESGMVAAENSLAISERLESLVVAIARANAIPALKRDIPAEISGSYAFSAGAYVEPGFARLLPIDILGELVRSESIRAFYFSNFDGQDWVFVERSNYNTIPSELQQGIESSFELYDVQLNFEF
jgi:hypothetical protein